ncbi:hypothetical protein Acsp04_63630 [Actinomadura sp. NBRC 104425]|uniref:nucleoside hydrolase n=1 Tax=Actinomadura sp. NBRC 104425 TaxID=3032204 RepID=UPI0024A51AC9|nr:nucleoside hydrolase [Actinomadura sp. NBRC 104425]GLZ16128.1 hypothetical protein Acsp04_63630 [Actinomadura sp. NBRC 104425]
MTMKSDESPGVRHLREQRRAAADLGAAPVIIDTDIGGDPDDALAVAAAARTLPRLALVITSDETGSSFGPGQRARFARVLLDALQRAEVSVVEGCSVGDTRYYCVDGLVPDGVGRQPTGVVDAVRAVCERASGPVCWVGMGPLSNLAHIVEHAPDLLPRLSVTQMGGALAYRHPDRAEHNIRLDMPAARTVLDAVADRRLAVPEFVISDVTWNQQIAVDSQSRIYRALTASGAPSWATLVARHLDRWFERFHPESLQHDALTLSVALDLPYVTSGPVRVVMDEIGRMRRGREQEGVLLRLSVSARYRPFMRWLTRTLDPATQLDATPKAG